MAEESNAAESDEEAQTAPTPAPTQETRRATKAAASVKKIRIRNDEAKPNDCPTQ